jgi:N-acetylglucosamine kinase-like BadF-type ATPase
MPTPAWISKFAMSSDGDLALRVFLKKLKKFGVVTLAKRGKGSEIILMRPDSPEKKQGPQYPIKNHGSNTMIKRPVIKAVLRRFDISGDDFWNK